MAAPRQARRSSRTELRASDADRERVIGRLREHYGSGRLSDEELAQRVEAAYAARTVSDLRALTADLPSSTRPRASRSRHGLALSLRIHLAVYVVVNVMLIGIWAASGGGYFWPVWPMLGWGIGLGGHAAPLLAGVGSRRRSRGSLSGASTPQAPATSVDEVASTVASERPSLRPAAAPDGTVTILFSDIERSTELNERLGDVRWLELLRAHNRIVRDEIDRHGGFQVKSQGDGFMIAFPSARRAVQCAKAVQRAIDSYLGEHPDGPIRIRIGLHTGEAIRDERDFYGKNVVVAARIADQARGGEILASSVVKQLTESAGDVRFEGEQDVELEGLAGSHTVYRVV